MKDLKSGNVRLLWAALLVDALVLWILLEFGDPEQLRWTHLATRVGLAAAAPVFLMLLNGVVPAAIKSTWVFWRLKHALPGHRAFSVYARRGDPRVSVEALERRLGQLPVSPEEQNQTWYRMYREVEAQPAVVDAHGQYLLFRDLASISLLLSLTIGIMAWVLLTFSAAMIVVVVFGAQYLAAMVAARTQAAAFITNVLAAHSAR